MLDYIFGAMIYEKIMKDDSIKNKFRAFFIRGALYVGIPLGIVAAISLFILGMNGNLASFHIIALLILWGAVTIVFPLVQWKIGSSGEKKK